MAFEVQHQVDLPTDTLLRAKLKDLEVNEIPKRDGGSFQKLKWVFEVTAQGEYFGKTIQADTSAYFSDSPYNIPNNWAKALLQREIPAGQVISESDLIGLPCDVTVRYEDDRKDPKKKWARVDDVFEVSDNGFQDPPF